MSEEDSTSYSRLSGQTARSLLQQYDKRTKEAEKKLADAEKQLETQRDLARRYHDKYVELKQQQVSANSTTNKTTVNSDKEVNKKSDEKETSDNTQNLKANKNDLNGIKGTSTHKSVDNNKQASKGAAEIEKEKSDKKPDDNKLSNEGQKIDKKNPSKRPPSSLVTKNVKENDHDQKVAEKHENNNKKNNNGDVAEDDLDDDRALFKRHIVKLAEANALKLTSSPIRVVDVVRKSEVLIEENEALATEVQRLKFDNTELIRKAKYDEDERIKAQRAFATSEAAREELEKRLEKEIEKNRELEKTLNKQTSRWINSQQQLQYMSHSYNQFVDSGGSKFRPSTANPQMTDVYLSSKPNARLAKKRGVRK